MTKRATNPNPNLLAFVLHAASQAGRFTTENYFTAVTST
jgi:hypothetical protein